MIETLRTHGSVHAWVVHGGGLDELTTTGTSQVIELHDGEIRHFTVDPAGLGLAPAHTTTWPVATPPHNAAVVRRVLAGEPGPHRDIVVLNAAAGLVVGGARRVARRRHRARRVQPIDHGARDGHPRSLRGGVAGSRR